MPLEPHTAIVSLCFDDGYSVQYDTFHQVLRDYGIKATFYVITNKIGVSGHMTWTQLNDLAKAGNEIGSHTHSHPHLTQLSTKELDLELRTSQELLKPYDCRTLAYPYGEYDSKVLRCAQEHYLAARGYYDLSKKSRDFGFNLRPHGELHNLKVIPTETATPMHSIPLFNLSQSLFQTSIREMTRSASEKEAWMILVFHGQNGIAFNLRWDLKLASKFRWMCEYLTRTCNLRILTISKATELLSDQS